MQVATYSVSETQVAYGTADVLTKAGMCLVAFLVATRPETA